MTSQSSRSFSVLMGGVLDSHGVQQEHHVDNTEEEPEASRSAYCNLTSRSDRLKLLHTYRLSADDMKTGALNIDENTATL